MPPVPSKLKDVKGFQRSTSGPSSTLPSSGEVHEVLNDNTVLVTFPTGEQILRLGGKRKCAPCLLAKRGKCRVDPRNPHPCLNCIELNRQDRCRFESTPQVSPLETAHDAESVHRIASLESTVVKLTSMVSELISHSSATTTNASNRIGYTRVEVALINRNEQVHETAITQYEPLQTITPVTTPSKIVIAPPPTVPNLQSQPQTSSNSFPVDPPERPKKFPNCAEIYNVISVHKPPAIIGPVSRFVINYWICKDTTIKDFRVSKFKSLIEHPNVEWLMLQWNEPELNCEVFALFMVNVQIGLCSSLVHSGFGGRQSDGGQWSKHSLAWWVLSMDDLKQLFVVGQQVLEVMNWPDPVMIKEFFDPSQTECSVQQLTLYAEQLLPTLSRLELLVTHFDVTSFLSEQLSNHALVLGDDGHGHSMFQAFVWL